MAGKPAARLGDTALDCADPIDTPTGTVVAAGTVLINGIPAAKQNDQVVGVDVHIVMIPSPAGPVPTPLPHPFSGMIDGDTEPSVEIMGMPAAILGSTASAMPPHIPQGGPFQIPPGNKATIMMGSPDVLIGSGDSGGSADDLGAGATSTITEDGTYFDVKWGGQSSPFNSFVGSDSEEAEPGHFLHVRFVDKGGKPISGPKYTVEDADGEEWEGTLAGGTIRKDQENAGTATIKLKKGTNAKWGSPSAKPGDKVDLKVDAVGIDNDSNSKVIFTIYERDKDRADKKIHTIYQEKIVEQRDGLRQLVNY